MRAGSFRSTRSSSPPRRRCRSFCASTRCRPESGERDRSSRSSSSACGPISSRSRRVSRTAFPSGRCSSRTMRPARSRPVTTARPSAATPCRVPPRAPSSTRSTRSCSTTCGVAALSLPSALAPLPGVRLRARPRAAHRHRGRGCRGRTSSMRARESGLLVLTAGENVVRLAPPLTVTARDVDDALHDSRPHILLACRIL